MFADGLYKRIPYLDIERVETEKPTALRDLLWIPAVVFMREDVALVGSGSRVHLPALAPFSWKHEDNAVKLGRTSVVEESESGAIAPYGAKLLLCGDEEIPLLEIRELIFDPVKE